MEKAYEDLSQLVRRVMKQKNLRARDIERRCQREITSSYISRILSGSVHNLTVEKLVALARGLDEDPYDLFRASYGRWPVEASGGQHARSVSALVFVELMQKVALAPALTEIMREVARLTPDEYPIILAYLESLNERSNACAQQQRQR